MILVDEKKCTLCGACVEACPYRALAIQGGAIVVDRDLCAECGACLHLCPVGAIYEVEPAPVVAVDANAEPILRADTAAVAQPAKPERTPILASPPTTPSPLWVGVLPLAARFVAGLADWWLDRRRPTGWDARRGPAIRYGLGRGRPPAPPLAGLRPVRPRRWRGGRGL
jgi:NAD-dependent dihydropyrimidine dehydrogenase PreA subunit